jgi:plasmid stabilization system protein ParE
MTDIVRRRDRARQDLIDIYRHLAREVGVRTASRFLAQAEATFNRLAGMP